MPAYIRESPASVTQPASSAERAGNKYANTVAAAAEEHECPDGYEGWFGSPKVSVIDVASGTVTTVAEGTKWPYRVLFSPDVKTVALPDLGGEELRFIDRASKRELSRIAFTGGGPQGITRTPDGRYIFQSLSKQARVAIIDANTRTVVGYLAAGETPDGVAYTTRTQPAR